jgi:Protein of unknown function (DUF3489)
MSPAPDAGSLIEQIAEATGWQHHTIRGAVSGALKKARSAARSRRSSGSRSRPRAREVGPNKTGAKRSSTVYRVTG